MKKWEYKTVKSIRTKTVEELNEYLNEMGKEGW
jgi:ribosomal protein L29